MPVDQSPGDTFKAATAFMLSGQLAEADRALSASVEAGKAGMEELQAWIKVASIMGQHGTALERLSVVKAKLPAIDLSEVEVQLLIRSRRFDEALALMQTKNHSAEPWREHYGLAQSLNAAETHLRSRDSGGQPLKAFCINLDGQPQKWKRCKAESAEANLDLIRVPGLKGSTVPTRMLARLGTNIDPRGKGTLGCFIGHFHAWEAFFDSGLSFGIILEDDFRPCIRFPSDAAAFDFPPGFDLCWISERMAIGGREALAYNHIADVAARILGGVTAGQRYHWAVGAFGYVLSREGARKLLDYVSEDGFFGDVDVRMLAYSLTAEERARISPHALSGQLMAEHLKSARPRQPLKTFAASVGLIGVVRSGSDRKDLNRMAAAASPA